MHHAVGVLISPTRVRITLIRDLIIIKISRSRSQGSSGQDAERGATGGLYTLSTVIVRGSDGHASSIVSFSGVVFVMHMLFVFGIANDVDFTKKGFTASMLR